MLKSAKAQSTMPITSVGRGPMRAISIGMARNEISEPMPRGMLAQPLCSAE